MVTAAAGAHPIRLLKNREPASLAAVRVDEPQGRPTPCVIADQLARPCTMVPSSKARSKAIIISTR
jgi:hypothetical protein